VLMRALYGQGTPREAAEAAMAFIFVLRTDAAIAFGLIAFIEGQFVALVVIAAPLRCRVCFASARDQLDPRIRVLARHDLQAAQSLTGASNPFSW
jgi:hypothetical protein